MKPIYSEEEAARIKKRLESKQLVVKNKKAKARQAAEEIQDSKLIDDLTNHHDKYYFESIDV